jgi:glycogen operon protein
VPGIDPAFTTWGASRKPETSWAHTIIYEMHVKGFTQRHPLIPESDRGTFAGLSHPAIPAYLRSLGVTSVELLPIHSFIDDSYLVDKGLRNYWGYNSIGFFAPETRYLRTDGANEFRP